MNKSLRAKNGHVAQAPRKPLAAKNSFIHLPHGEEKGLKKVRADQKKN